MIDIHISYCIVCRFLFAISIRCSCRVFLSTGIHIYVYISSASTHTVWGHLLVHYLYTQLILSRQPVIFIVYLYFVIGPFLCLIQVLALLLRAYKASDIRETPFHLSRASFNNGKWYNRCWCFPKSCVLIGSFSVFLSIQQEKRGAIFICRLTLLSINLLHHQ